VAAEKRRRTKMTSQRRIRVPTARSSIARSPIELNRTKSMWNNKYKGYCFKLICTKLEVAFKPCHKLSAKLGGYASKDNESKDD
jgi:hypothetical protein